MHLVECAMWLPWSAEKAFDFFGDIHQLDRVTPPWFRLVPVEPTPRTLEPGTRIDYRLRWRGLPTRWQSVIRTWDRPHEIVYEQGRGLFKSFRHEHFFSQEGDGTRVIDRIIFESPGGQWIRHRFVEPDLTKVLEFRRRAVGGIE